MTYQYEERYVAFLDILGFRDLIKRTVGPTPTVTVEHVVSALRVPKQVNLKGIELGRIGDITAAKHTLTAFSDCVVISTLASEQGLMNLLFHVRAIMFRLLRLGFLVRGGITQGLTYHQEGMIFGPAMSEAYRLESKVAVFPRIILDPAIVKTGLAAAEPVGQLFGRMIKHYDEHYMVDPLWALRMAADSESGFVGKWAELVDKIRRFLDEEETRLQSKPVPVAHEEIKVSPVEKVRWFRQHFEGATDRNWVDTLEAPYPSLSIKDVLSGFENANR